MHAAINYREMATRKQADEQLAQYQKVETLGNLSGGMAHNLNNLLLPILVLTKSTLNELPQGSKGRERLEKVLEAGERAKILVSDVLNFSHKTEISANPLDFCASVRKSKVKTPFNSFALSSHRASVLTSFSPTTSAWFARTQHRSASS